MAQRTPPLSRSGVGSGFLGTDPNPNALVADKHYHLAQAFERFYANSLIRFL